MDAGHCTTRFGLFVLALVLQSSLPALAYADGLPQARVALVADYSDDPVLGIVGTGAVGTVETPAPAVPRECKSRYMVGPGMGIALGPTVIIGGGYMVAAGSLGGLWDSELTSRDKGLIAGGSFVIAGGAATFIYSLVKLSRNRHERRRVCDSDTPHSD